MWQTFLEYGNQLKIILNKEIHSLVKNYDPNISNIILEYLYFEIDKAKAKWDLFMAMLKRRQVILFLNDAKILSSQLNFNIFIVWVGTLETVYCKLLDRIIKKEELLSLRFTKKNIDKKIKFLIFEDDYHSNKIQYSLDNIISYKVIKSRFLNYPYLDDGDFFCYKKLYLDYLAGFKHKSDQLFFKTCYNIYMSYVLKYRKEIFQARCKYFKLDYLYDEEGMTVDGFDEYGFDKSGFDRDGFNISGFDRQGYNKEGYNCYGFDRNGSYFYDKNTG